MANRFALMGATLWTKRLAKVLSEHGGIKCQPVSELTPWDSWKLLGLIRCKVAIRVGFRPGQIRPRGLLIDLVSIFFVLFGGQLVFYWTGSDVQRTVVQHQKGSSLSGVWGRGVSRWLSQRSRHCVAAPWLADELQSLAIEAVCLPFPSPTKKFESLALARASRSDHFQVLTYIPDHNPENYCGEEIVHAAELLPDVDFRVMGGSGSWCLHRPDNLEFMGWVDAAEQYRNSSVVVRAVRHDALGGTVREALLCGCYVIYTFPHPHTTPLELTGVVAQDGRYLADAIALFRTRFSSYELPINLEAREWVLENLGEAKLARNLVAFLNA